MKKAAAIQAQLVDMRNVGAHKSLKLTLHVPEELALQAIEAFGWPTGAAPVTVALARLADGASASAPRGAERDLSDGDAPASRPRASLAQQAGICCNDPLFSKFLTHNFGEPIESALAAAHLVRSFCGINSRSELLTGTPAATRWRELHSDYLVWRDNPELTTDAAA